MKLALNIFFFGLGLLCYWMFNDYLVQKSYVSLKEIWVTAYESGRKDGYAFGKAEFQMTHDQINSTCMFWEFTFDKDKRIKDKTNDE